MVIVKQEEDEKIEKELQELNDEFLELKTKIGVLRKKGKDPFSAEINSLDFNPKLKMAKATYEKEDIHELRGLLDEIKSELEESEKGSYFMQATKLIEEAYE